MREKKEFLLYVIPSVLAFALSGVYAIVDGFFVGNSIGDAGLAAINVAYPVTALLQALGTGIGMGGAVQYSIHAGEDKREEQRAYISWTLLLLAVSSLAAVLLLFPSVSAILSAFGAKGQLLEMGKEYLQVIIFGAVFQIFGACASHQEYRRLCFCHVRHDRRLSHKYSSGLSLCVGIWIWAGRRCGCNHHRPDSYCGGMRGVCTEEGTRTVTKVRDKAWKAVRKYHEGGSVAFWTYLFAEHSADPYE